MPMNYDIAIKAAARRYYVMLGMDRHQISKILPPTAITIGNWADEGNWDSQKKMLHASSLQIGLMALSQIYRIYEAAENENRVSTPAEADMISKHKKNMDDINKDLTFVSNAIDANGMFMEMIRERDEEAFNKVVEYSLEFTESLARKFGDI